MRWGPTGCSAYVFHLRTQARSAWKKLNLSPTSSASVLLTIPIERVMSSAEDTLAPAFENRPTDVTEENLQARIRGLLLMALSNKFGLMLLTTGNKSEMSVGYATLYGDMCGGFSVLKDIYKTDVYRLSRWRNAHRPDLAKGPEGHVIPERTLTRAPDGRASSESNRSGLTAALRSARCHTDGPD